MVFFVAPGRLLTFQVDLKSNHRNLNAHSESYFLLLFKASGLSQAHLKTYPDGIFYCTRARQTAWKSNPDGLISYFLLQFRVSGRCQEHQEIHPDNISYYIGARQAGLKRLTPRRQGQGQRPG